MLTNELDDFLTPRLRSKYGLGSFGITVGMMAVLGGALVLALVVAAYEIHRSAQAIARAEAAARKTAVARGRMSEPPSHNWQLMEQHKYCAFLSHYKVSTLFVAHVNPAQSHLPLVPIVYCCIAGGGWLRRSLCVTMTRTWEVPLADQLILCACLVLFQTSAILSDE